MREWEINRKRGRKKVKEWDRKITCQEVKCTKVFQIMKKILWEKRETESETVRDREREVKVKGK